jgi:hypothetical protein
MSTTRITSVSPQRPDDVVADEPAMAPGAVAQAADRARDAGDVVSIAIAGVGILVNPVEVVGTARPRISEEAAK